MLILLAVFFNTGDSHMLFSFQVCFKGGVGRVTDGPDLPRADSIPGAWEFRYENWKSSPKTKKSW